jgi:hypothetical protein
MAGPTPHQTSDGLRWNGRRIPLLSWVVSWFTKSGDRITIADLIAIALIAGVLLTVVQGNGSDSSHGATAEGTAGGSVTNSESSESPLGAGKAGTVAPDSSTVVEYADNRAGSPVFSDPTGAPVEGGPSRIPYGTEVVVSCFAPDESGISSVSGFYRIASGKWQGSYVVADTMTNGGEVGETDTPNVDNRVRECSAEEE